MRLSLIHLKKSWLVFFAGLLVAIFSSVCLSITFAQEADDEESGVKTTNSQSETSSTSSDPEKKTTTKTTTVLKTDVRTETTVTTKQDGDGDGLWDDEDPHPTVAEIYIVKDDNRNGIVDMFE